jgi:hypothetical protein
MTSVPQLQDADGRNMTSIPQLQDAIGNNMKDFTSLLQDGQFEKYRPSQIDQFVHFQRICDTDIVIMDRRSTVERRYWHSKDIEGMAPDACHIGPWHHCHTATIFRRNTKIPHKGGVYTDS